jgi:hypothetical protein
MAGAVADRKRDVRCHGSPLSGLRKPDGNWSGGRGTMPPVADAHPRPGSGEMVQGDAAAPADLAHLAEKREQARFQPSSGGCWVILRALATIFAE